MGIFCDSKTFKTPMWANPFAAPAPNTKATFACLDVGWGATAAFGTQPIKLKINIMPKSTSPMMIIFLFMSVFFIALVL
jgi:hypothetical protein